MTHYRRTEPEGAASVAASAVALIVGLGTAAAAWYLTRLLMSRERLDRTIPSASDASSQSALLSGRADAFPR